MGLGLKHLNSIQPISLRAGPDDCYWLIACIQSWRDSLFFQIKCLIKKFSPLQFEIYIFYGEVAEWLKAPAWKACVRQRTEGSNPSLTAK